jgi:hypothetical protein
MLERRSYLKNSVLSAGLFFSAESIRSAKAKKRPNIIYVFTDQQSAPGQ